MYVPNWFILLSRHWSLNLLASATYHIIAASIYPLSGAVNFYHIFSHSYSNSFLFKWKSIFTCGVHAACQLLGSVASRTFEIPLPREVSYKCAGWIATGDESVLTNSANNQQQAFHVEIGKASWSLPHIPCWIIFCYFMKYILL